ncbi:hypothetical protein B484DRAFT_402558, partial [Ochromonadaceae sp. CCMP2298]
VTHNNDGGALVLASGGGDEDEGARGGETGVGGREGKEESEGGGGSGGKEGASGGTSGSGTSGSGGSSTSGGGGGSGVKDFIINNRRRVGCYVVHLLECVLRPDMELKEILACTLRVARARGYRCLYPNTGHILIKPYSSAHLEGGEAGGGGITDRREWDHIDVQVVMSKELRQRVLLCQFLRKVPNYGAGLGGLLLYGIAGGTAPLPLQTMAFISRLKRDLTQSQLCLSSLYDAPPHTVCALPQPEGVDPHFRAQLHRSLWANMWGQLERDVGDMGEHLQAQNRQCFEFLQTLEPIY